MAIKRNNSHGKETQIKVQQVLTILLDYAEGILSDSRKSKPMVCRWNDQKMLWVNDATVRMIYQAAKDVVLTGEDVKRAFGDLEELGILNDRRGAKSQGSSFWQLELSFGMTDRARVLAEFDRLWKRKWNSEKTAPIAQPKSGLKPRAPRPGVRLPENFVARPAALDAVKEKLLAADERTLVVSAIAGLGGLGKSVLATALVLDDEVQSRFEDGILWVTLGQNPDLLREVGEWIRKLDRSKESLSSTTLEGAKGYLQSLVAERRMLLVIDDVWNAAHAEWFRVGGPGCRVLVTTREAQVVGADYYALDLMTEGEAIELVRGKLGEKWDASQEAGVRRFARVVGYLPLALDLSANLVADGMTWGELQVEFEDERRAVALDLLDSSESFELMSEQEREREERKHSLKACFNLSLKRLNPEQLRRFAWLGVLPEDVLVDARMVRTLWDVSEVMAKKGLIDLFRRSLLLIGTETDEGERRYRIHDLLHYTARGLIENGGLGVESLAAAHGAFLGRYGVLDYGKKLCGLVNDGYIHRHLTWHLVMAGRSDAVHDLMGASDTAGRNAWFEACEEIGEPAIFVQDLRLGWKLAEEMEGRERGIALQCGYALMNATLNMLLDNLPVEVMAAFVKGGFWSVERAWAYVEQMQDQRKIAEAIRALASYLTKPLFQIALEKARSIQNKYDRALTTCSLAKIDNQFFSEALAISRSIHKEDQRAIALLEISKINSEYLPEAFDQIRLLQDSYPYELNPGYFYGCELLRAELLVELAGLDKIYISKALEETKKLTGYELVNVLMQLNHLDSSCFHVALKAVKLIKDGDPYYYALALVELAKYDSSLIPKVYEVFQSIDYLELEVKILVKLAQVDRSYLMEAFQLVDSLSMKQDDYLNLFLELAVIDQIYLNDLHEKSRLIQDGYSQVKVLTQLICFEPAIFAYALEIAKTINNLEERSFALLTLAKYDQVCLPTAAETIFSLKNSFNISILLSWLSSLDETYLPEALESITSWEGKRCGMFIIYPPIPWEAERSLLLLANRYKSYSTELINSAQSISVKHRDIYSRFLIEIAKHDNEYIPKALEVIRCLREDDYAWGMVQLEKIDRKYIPEARVRSGLVQNRVNRVNILFELLKIDHVYLPDFLEEINLIEDVDCRARSFINLIEIDENYFLEALNMTQSLPRIQLIPGSSQYTQALMLLIQNTPDRFLPVVYQTITQITHLPTRAEALSSYLSRLPLTNLSYPDWRSHLPLLAHRKRSELMQDLVMLYPAIIALGGEGAMWGVVDEMKRVCGQWR